MFNRGKKLKILFVATEQKPFAQVGGLGAVMHSLPKALSELGHDVRVMMPRYLSIDDKANHLMMHHRGLNVPTGNQTGELYLVCNVKKYEGGTEADKPNTTYFLENMEYYEKRANVYGYADDTVRWALLCRGTLEFLLVSDWLPEVIVCSDWTAGYLPNYLKTEYINYRKLKNIICLFSIHLLAFQGNFKHKFIAETDYDSGQGPLPGFADPKMNFMNGARRGITYADVINTVSPTHAKEILTAERGEGLEDLLKEKRAILFGILNGIDYASWNPTTDQQIRQNFSDQNLGLRGENKKAIQEHFGLKVDPAAFLISIVSRLWEQKGFDLLFDLVPQLLGEINMQLVIVGEGDGKYMDFFQALQQQFPERIGFHFKFDPILPRVIFAGADAILIPSKFEPSGLTQMEAMHYGTVPIARKTGGLADTVFDYDPKHQTGTGFVFEKFDQFSLLIALVRAYENFKNQTVWQTLQVNGMTRDFSWLNSARAYEAMLLKTINHQPPKNNGDTYDTTL